jgi:hypothetical protein
MKNMKYPPKIRPLTPTYIVESKGEANKRNEPKSSWIDSVDHTIATGTTSVASAMFFFWRRLEIMISF